MSREFLALGLITDSSPRRVEKKKPSADHNHVAQREWLLFTELIYWCPAE